mmetsp:Transcript_15146/g.36046  ORF Transcript_15146/g.36046 Transcript_15146/m.36046 type:complete len:80 (-) Transcript_15146:419-658(-)
MHAIVWWSGVFMRAPWMSVYRYQSLQCCRETSTNEPHQLTLSIPCRQHALSVNDSLSHRPTSIHPSIDTPQPSVPSADA